MTLAFTLFKPQWYDPLLPLKGSSYSFRLKPSLYLILFFLLSYIFLYCCSFDSYRALIISRRPKISISKLIFQVCMSLENHHRTLSLIVTHYIWAVCSPTDAHGRASYARPCALPLSIYINPSEFGKYLSLADCI